MLTRQSIMMLQQQHGAPGALAGRQRKRGPTGHATPHWRCASGVHSEMTRNARLMATRAWLKDPLQLLQGKGSSSAGTALASNKGRPDAADVMRRYYEAYNRLDFDTCESMLAEDVEWHDLGLYEEPFRGRDAVMAFKRKIGLQVPDFKFVIDDITQSDSRKVGIMWHVEVDGQPFPFSRGCSFYTVDEQGKISTARDLVEVPNKPGDLGISLLRGLVPLVRAAGPEATRKGLPPAGAIALWSFYIAYSGYILFSTSAPGAPAWAQPPELLMEVFNESLNFFYVNIFLADWGLSPVPSVACPPVSEALFNFVAAWGVLFLPVALRDAKFQKVGNVWQWWTASMFLTNVFFIPWLALRAGVTDAAPASKAPSEEEASYPSWTPVNVAVAVAVGLFSVWWALEARPEYGDLAARWAYHTEALATNRIYFAFVVDMSLYSVWQYLLLKDVPSATPLHKFVPFFGLAAHLLTAKPAPQDPKAAP